MTVENIITIISVIAAISGIIFGAAAFARNKRDDNREDGSYRSDIGYIKSKHGRHQAQAGQAGTAVS